MKKKLVLVLCVFLCVTVLAINYFFVRIGGKETGTARYIYGDKNISTEISKEDMNAIVEILNGKHIRIFGLPSCGFDENVAIIIDNKTLCIACDDCGFIYFKERKGYINLNDDENEKIRLILESYGFEWPCV